MKKKLLGLFMALVFTASAINPASVYAAGSEKDKKKEILTVETAVRYAVSNSNTIRNSEENNYITGKTHEWLLYDFYASQTEDEFVANAIRLTENEMQTSLSYPDMETQKKSIELTVTRYFGVIKQAEQGLALYDSDLALKKRELEITEVRAKLGMVTASALDSARQSYESAAARRFEKVKALDDAYTNLTKITGVLDASRFEIDFGFSYAPLKKVNLSGYIEAAAETNFKLTEAKEKYRVAEYKHDLTMFDTEFDKEKSEISLAQQQRNIDELRKNLGGSVTTLYNDILLLEQSYDLKLSDIAAMEKQLAVKQTQLSLGKITRIDVDRYEYEIESARKSLADIVADHENKALQFINTKLL